MPLKSKREDVARVIGKGATPTEGSDGSMRYKVAGGTITFYFVDAKFVATKKLYPSAEGTVLEVILQHENSSDTPESLDLNNKKNFEKEAGKNGIVYRNLKDGITYTFIEGRLKTTRYTASTEQLAKMRKM